MEHEEDFLSAAAILKELDLQLSLVGESAVNKEHSEVRKEIETHFDKCTRAILARKENLLREADARFQDKRKILELKEKEVKATIETCRKLLLAGVGVYNKDKRDEAKNIWKSVMEFKPKSGESDQIKVNFQENFLAYVADYGSISAAYVDLSRLSRSPDLEPTKLSKSSGASSPKSTSSSEPPATKLAKSTSVEQSKLSKSNNFDPPAAKLGKSASVEQAAPRLNKSSGMEPTGSGIRGSSESPTTKLNKSSSGEAPKQGKMVPLIIDTPTPIQRLAKTSLTENLKLDKPPTPELKLGKISADSSRFGKASAEAGIRVSLNFESPRDKPTLADDERKVALLNKVSTVTELNYGLEGRIGSNAQLRHPNGICFNPHDRSVYVCDNGHVIFKVTPAGEAKIFAAKRGDNQLHNPMGITCYYKENCFFVTSQLQHTIKMINSMGIVTVVAGCGKEGMQDGVGIKTGFSHPVGITVDQLTGDLYVSDFGNHTIRRISPQGVVTTLAGTAGKKGFADGVGKSAVFNCPVDICFNGKDQSLVVCDSNNHKIRRVALNGEVSTIGEVSRPSGIVITPKGSFLVSSQSENKIYHLFKDSGGYKIETIAGSGKKGGDDGSGVECSFSGISGITLDEKSNTCYVAEFEFSRIRKIALNYQ